MIASSQSMDIDGAGGSFPAIARATGDPQGLLPFSGAIVQIDVHQSVRLPECRRLVARFDVDIWLPANASLEVVAGTLSRRKDAWLSAFKKQPVAGRFEVTWMAEKQMRRMASSVEFPAGTWRIPHAVSVDLTDYIDMPFLYSLVQDFEKTTLDHLELTLADRDASWLKSLVISESLDFCLSRAREKAQLRGSCLGDLRIMNLDVRIPAWRYTSIEQLANYSGETTALVSGLVCYSATAVTKH